MFTVDNGDVGVVAKANKAEFLCVIFTPGSDQIRNVQMCRCGIELNVSVNHLLHFHHTLMNIYVRIPGYHVGLIIINLF